MPDFIVAILDEDFEETDLLEAENAIHRCNVRYGACEDEAEITAPYIAIPLASLTHRKDGSLKF